MGIEKSSTSMYNPSFFKEKTILITGGSGSIGSYLMDELLKTECKAIRILTNSEYELFRVQKKYGQNKKLADDVK